MRIAASWAPVKRTWTPCWRSCSRQAGHRRAWQGSRRQGAPPCPSCVPVSCPRAGGTGKATCLRLPQMQFINVFFGSFLLLEEKPLRFVKAVPD